ncbi:MAG: hypothetical protein EOO69_04665 [Moraxellaceae bacterium]|nr:MAG: hypothetical protein EOO69_04665 [Moraxellaceae bacterium]
MKVLKENPAGLHISQLTGLARLSVNTTRQALDAIKAVQLGEDWFLPEDRSAKKPEPEAAPVLMAKAPVVEVIKPAEENRPADVVSLASESVPAEVEPLASTPEQNAVEPVPVLRRIKKAFEDNPAGLTAEELMTLAECSRKEMGGSMSYVRKTWFPVELKTCEDGQRRYVPGAPISKAKSVKQVDPKLDTPITEVFGKSTSDELGQNPLPDPLTTPCTPVAAIIQETPKNIQDQEEIIQKSPEIITSVPTTLSLVEQIKASKQVEIVRTEQITLDGQQLTQLLKDTFGFDDVQIFTNWNIGVDVSKVILKKVVNEVASQ